MNRLKQDGGGWKIHGNMSDGKRVEAWFHPETGNVLLINQRRTTLYRAED